MIKVIMTQTVTVEINGQIITLTPKEATELAAAIVDKLGRPLQSSPEWQPAPAGPAVVPPYTYPPYTVTCSTNPNAWNILERTEQTARSNMK